MASEYIDINTNYGKVVGVPGTPVIVSYNVAGGASAATAAALTADTMYVLVATTDVRLAFASNPTAAATSMLWPGLVPLYFKTPHETTGTLKVAALSNIAVAGTAVITPLAGDRV